MPSPSLSDPSTQASAGAITSSGSANSPNHPTTTLKCVLSIPILNGQQKVIGVSQLVNKMATGDQQFNEVDVSTLEVIIIS